MSEREDGSADETRPIPAGEPQAQPPYPGEPPAQPPYPQPGSGHAAWPALPLSYPPGRQFAGFPRWMWPSVAATALVVGLLGGILAGVVVSTSMQQVTGGVLVDESAPAPLKPRNGSVAAVASRLLPSTVQVLTRGGGGSRATGSGFVIDRRGRVVTNNHVVAAAADSGSISVVDSSGRMQAARILGRSPVYDIAVLQVDDGRRLRPAALGSSRSMNVGDTVVAIGSPLGLNSTVTSGIVSALDRPVTIGAGNASSYINALQTDAAINPGNSGGPLVNLTGQVVGVNSAIATTGTFTGEAGNIGVGFAIPMEQVRITAGQILRTGKARYPVIGANVNPATRDSRGAQVVDAPAGSPAQRAGLREGDVVVAVNDVAVTDGIGLIVAIRSHRPGETVVLRVDRDGRQLTLRVRLAGRTG